MTFTTHPPRVSWIPAHPVYGSVSMLRYWKLLEAAIRPGDPFSCSSVLSVASGGQVEKSGPGRRYLTRRFIYPLRVGLRAKGDLVHVLDHSWADLLPHAPRRAVKIVTVHDLIPLRFPGELSDAQAGRFRKWVGYLKQADAIVAVSEYTKREVEELLGIEGARIHVVFNGVQLPADVAAPAGQRDSGGTGAFRIGSIGSTLERKNLSILPAALGRLQAVIGRKVVLVRVGAKLPAPLAAELRNSLGDDGLIELGSLPDEAIPGYYAGLDAVVIPSLYEGFGLPVIEGMAARVPVVSSNATSLPEVGGNLAFYFDPRSPDELAAVLARIASEGVSDRQLDAAYERAKSLSWRTCLEATYQVYQAALEQAGHSRDPSDFR